MTHCFEGIVNFVTDDLDDGVTFIPIQYNDIIRDICEGLITYNFFKSENIIGVVII